MKRIVSFILAAVCLLSAASLYGSASAASVSDYAAEYHVLTPEAAATAAAAKAQPAASETGSYPILTDVPEELEAAVAYVMENDLMEETSPFTFSPELVLSRGNALIVLYNLAGRPETTAPSFKDVKGDWWYTAPIGWASQAGIISGYGNGLFGPLDPLTREQLAVILYLYQKKTGYEMLPADLSGYKDAGTVSSFAADAVAWAVGADVLKPADGVIGPKEYATRGDMAQAVLALTYGKNNNIHQGTIQYSYLYPHDNASLRTGPGTQYEVITKLSSDGKLIVTAQQNGWYLVHTPSGLVGYLSTGNANSCATITRDLPNITEAAMPLTEEEAAAKLDQLQKTYAGKYWNNPKNSVVYSYKTNNMDSLLSSTPCNHDVTIATCNRHTGIASMPTSHPMGKMCMGFGSLLSDLVFGARAPVRAHKDLDALKIGDIVRLVGVSHSVVVTAILEDGIEVAECNADYHSCKVQWGRKVTFQKILSQPYLIVTRYPEPESDGSSQILYAPDKVSLYAAPGDKTPADTISRGEFLYVICRQLDGWYLVTRDNGGKGYVQADQLENLYRVA